MSYWCIAFCVLLLVTLMLVYFIKVAVMLELKVLKKFDATGILVISVNGLMFTSINAPVNTLISSDQTAMLTITSMSTSTSVSNGNKPASLTFKINGYVTPIPASMNILSGINLPVTPLKTSTTYTSSTSVTGFSFTGMSVTTSKPLNIDSSKFPSADSSLTAYTLAKNDGASVI